MQRGANLDDGARLVGKVSADAPGKRVIRGVPCSPEAKPAPSGAAGNTVDQYRLKPLQREVGRLIRELESESQNGNSGLVGACRVLPKAPTSHLAVIDEIVAFQDQRFEVERVIRIRPEIILNPDHRR